MKGLPLSMPRRRWMSQLGAAALATTGVPVSAAPAALQFPRLMGMNIGAKTYDKPEYQAALAAYDVVILDFPPDWRKGRGGDPIREVLKRLKTLNPGLLIGQYSTISDGPLWSEDRVRKLEETNWWLRDARGERARWTSEYKTYDVNITDWAKPDDRGRRYAEWLVERDFGLLHRGRPEFDIWFMDNATARPQVKQADWDGDGRDDSHTDPRIAAAFRAGHARSWRRIRQIDPKAMIVANTDDVSSREFSGQLDGAFLEGLFGKSWSLGTWAGWQQVMDRYHAAVRHVRSAKLVGFGVVGRDDDHRLLRFTLCSCLMDDGCFAYSSAQQQYSSAPWFDEFEAKLGRALDPPQLRPVHGPVFQRRFERGVALVNPSGEAVNVPVASGLRLLKGRQAPQVNTGESVRTLRLPAHDGRVLVQLDHPQGQQD